MTKAQGSIGSSFDDFLNDAGLLHEANAIALRRVLAWKLTQAMKAKGLSKLDIAERMGTSPSQIDRILDPSDNALTLETLSKAANAVDCQLTVTLTLVE